MFRYILNSSLGELIVEDAPKGWESKKYSISRSETYHGVMITVSADLQFWAEAYDYLEELDELEDSEATCTVEIQRYADAITGWKKEFKSNLDFNEKKQTNDGGQFISFPTYSDDFSNKILEREDIEIPYDRLTTLDDAEIIPFLNEYFTVSVLGIESLDKTLLKVSAFDAPLSSLFFPPISSESVASYWVPTTLQTPLFPLDDQEVNAVSFFAANNTNGILNGTINLNIVTQSQITFNIFVNDYKVGDVSNPILIYEQGVQASGIDTETVVVVPITDYVYDINSRISLLVSIVGGNGQLTNVNASETDFQVVSKYEPTDCQFVPPFEVATRLIESITGESDSVDSEFFGRTDSPTIYDEDGKGALCFNTNGKLVRGFPVGQVIEEEDKVAQLSFKFKEWFQNNEKIYNIGAGVVYDSDLETYKLKIESKKYFYGSDVILEIGRDVMEVNSFTRERDTTHYYGQIKTGSQFESPEEVSGLEEYNNVESYSGVLVNSNELDLVSTYIYGAYPWEFTRRKAYIGTETEDYRYDNYVMQMVMFRDGETLIQKTNQGYNTITGLDFVETAINLDITPQRNLRDNWGWLISTGYKQNRDTVLKYNTSETVTDLTSQKNSDAHLVDENNDINLNELESAYFSGNTDRFNAPLSSELFDLLRENPYGLIKYWNPFKSEFTYGWIKQTSTEPVDSSTNWEIINGYGINEEVPPFRLLEDGSYRLLEDGGKRKLE